MKILTNTSVFDNLNASEDITLLDNITFSGILSTGSNISIKQSLQTLSSRAIDKNIFNASGDIMYASAANTPAILAKGTDGKVLKLVSGVPSWQTDNDTIYTHPSHTGEVTGASALTITANAVTNTKLADMAVNTIKGRITAGTGDPEDLTAANVRTILNVADGANAYVHPANHSPSIITQDTDNRFVTDTQISTWNAKGTSNLALGETSVTAYRGDRGKTAYDHSQSAHAPSDANYYVHPTAAGSLHIPSGGAINQFLMYGGVSGTASWLAMNDTFHGTRGGGTLHATATTSVDGFMLAADKTILNRLADKVYKEIPASTDLDTIVETGTYLILAGTSHSSHPISGGNATLFVQADGGSTIAQMYFKSIYLYNRTAISAGGWNWGIYPWSRMSNAPTTISSASGNNVGTSGHTHGVTGFVTDNGQMSFATKNPSASSTMLDDYEEGTFTPRIDGSTTAGTGTYTKRLGRYIKIGGLVWYGIDMTWTAHTGTGNMVVKGLPFSITNYNSAMAVKIYNLTLGTGYYGVQAFAWGTTIDLERYGASSATALPMDTAAGITLAGCCSTV